MLSGAQCTQCRVQSSALDFDCTQCTVLSDPFGFQCKCTVHRALCVVWLDVICASTSTTQSFTPGPNCNGNTSYPNLPAFNKQAAYSSELFYNTDGEREGMRYYQIQRGRKYIALPRRVVEPLDDQHKNDFVGALALIDPRTGKFDMKLQTDSREGT